MKINKQYMLFISIMILIFLGALDKMTTAIALVGSAIVAITIGLDYKNITSDTCIGIILLLCFQNFAIGVGAHLTGNIDSSLKYLTQIPFLVTAIIFFCVVIRKKDSNYDKSKTYFIIYCFMILLSFFIGRGNLQSILINVRNMTVFYMAYIIGKAYINNRKEMDKFYNKFERISIFMLLAGILLLIGGYDLYRYIGIDEVYIAKGGASSLLGQLNPRFYTEIGYIGVTRMGSLYYEPVNLAYLYAIAFLMALFYKKDKKINLLFLICSGLGLLLTFGKGGILLAAVGVFVIIGSKIIKIILHNISDNKIIKYTLIIILFVTVVFCVYYYKNIGGTIQPHFWGLIQTWKNVLNKPVGHGLGTGGNMAEVFDSNSDSWLSSGGESGFMAFFYQIGFQGMLFLILSFINTAPKWKESHLDNFKKICAIIPYLLLAISFLQENTFTPQCIIPFMFVLGGAYNIYKETNYGK